MNNSIPLAGMPFTQRMSTASRGKNAEPKSYFIGDEVEIPWNVGKTVHRMKAARDMVISDITIDAGEIVSPTGCPVCIEAWKNGKYGGDVVIQHGATSFSQKSISLNKLDEIELRIVVKGDHESVTKVKNLWFLYCVS